MEHSNCFRNNFDFFTISFTTVVKLYSQFLKKSSKNLNTFYKKRNFSGILPPSLFLLEDSDTINSFHLKFEIRADTVTVVLKIQNVRDVKTQKVSGIRVSVHFLFISVQNWGIMFTYVLNIMADDHPGIIAAVSSAVEALGGNIESCSQTVLGGYFTLIMIATLTKEMKPQDLQKHLLKHTETACKIDVSVRRTTSIKPTDGKAERFVLTAFGPDVPGVVCRFSEYLADHEMNILDMYGCRQTNVEGEVQFLLTAQVEIPTKWNLALLQCDLKNIGSDINFTVVLQHENIFTATNHVRYR